MSGPTILVSWVSFNHDPFVRMKDGHYLIEDGEHVPGPALELMCNPSSPYAGRIHRAYFFCRRSGIEEGGLREVDPLESQVLEALRAELATRCPELQFTPVYWNTRSAPTAYKELFLFTAEQLRAIRKENPTASLVVNLSSGTPQMQVALLLALQARLAGQPVEAIQGIPRDKRRGQAILEQVPWNLLAELNRLAMVSPVADRPTRWSLADARSEPLARLSKQVEHVGNVPFPVLILGSRGTGKTHVAELLRARHLEYLGRVVPQCPWEFRLNCALFKGDLLKSELFGHEKGAFTGAHKQHVGLLERAKDDCIFLDEIHHLEPDAQAMLLLALEQDGTFRKVGGKQPIAASFRLIVASNRTREELKRESLFEDFHDRVSDFVLEVPDLRECGEDLPAIWDQVTQEACADVAGKRGGDQRVDENALKVEFEPWRDEVVRHLRGLRLPGNWRDLQRLARRLLAAGLGSSNYATFTLSTADVRRELECLRNEETDGHSHPVGRGPLFNDLPSPARCRQVLERAHAGSAPLSFKVLTAEWGRRLIEAAVEVAGSEKRAAPLLRLQPSTLNATRKRLNEEAEVADSQVRQPLEDAK